MCSFKHPSEIKIRDAVVFDVVENDSDDNIPKSVSKLNKIASYDDTDSDS